ncbi:MULTISPECIES: hypothetical protein [Pseudomonas]|uniref:Uncharacterized protein n=1 Tax=Pseudomonas wuhanensis TaxID=2954098 RepID=A0ABY9GWW2_9PSED|nr:MULTISPECIES: hypothetical protein [unclassified Pseudomonas]WLI14360.1 hypothetical protein PSH65_09655 [Pseudomonas sp. FP603]WLI20276.1 hypothetical protein PSH88_09675 [Pseudomonas sp. FP607]
MNFDQAKALRFQQWRSTLDDHDFRMQNPEAHRQHLHSMASTLVAEGLIDTLEQYDMNEMANAAYWHAVEELQSHPVRYCGASSYDLVACDGSLILGEIRQTIFHARRENQVEARTTYDGKVYRDGAGANLVFNPSGITARIEGLTLTLRDGRQFDLIETGRMILGVIYQPIDDPDMYRALVDAAQVALEGRDLRAYEKMRPFMDLASFSTCPACLDRFDRRDDCAACAGQGFVIKPPGSGLR